MTDIEMGKYLSYILRHHPEDINIKVDKNGYVNVDELIEKINATEKYKGEMSRERLDRIVEENNKKRYSYNEDKTKIRAVQGHSFLPCKGRPACPGWLQGIFSALPCPVKGHPSASRHCGVS